MSRIALYGGSFNPPHRGHLNVVRWLLEECPLAFFDEVWVLPTSQHAFDKDLLEYDVREKLVNAMLTELPDRARVCTVRRTETYTADLLDHLEKERPSDVFVPIFGADILNETERWSRWEDILKRDPVVIARPGVEILTDLKLHVMEHRTKGAFSQEVSSTSIRERLGRSDLTYLVGQGADLPAPVMSLIEKLGLYGFKVEDEDSDSVCLDWVDVPIDLILQKYTPEEGFALLGNIEQVLKVVPVEGPPGTFRTYDARFLVVRDSQVQTAYTKDLRQWHERKTAARARGQEFTTPEPQPRSPSLTFLSVKTPAKTSVGRYLGEVDGVHFFTRPSLLGNLLGIV